MNRLEPTRQESIRVWAQAQKNALHEAVRNTPVNPPAVAAGLGTGSGGSFSGSTCTLVLIAWPNDDSSFDEYVINFETPVFNVSKLTSSFTSNANGHTHNDYSVNISIDLYDADAEAWVNVWGRQLDPTGSADTEYFIKDTVDASFITIGTVTALKIWSSPELGNTFHDWDGIDDKFILHSECTNACSTKLFLRGEVNWEGQGGSNSFDNFIIDFKPISNVKQLISSFPDRFNSGDGNETAIAHIHDSEFETAKLSIDLWDSINGNWINVWNHELVNTFHPEDDLYGYVIGESISVCFPNIEEITKLKVYVDHPSDWTYHNWMNDDAFKFYGEYL
jgi:hypothetical protein